MQAGRRAVTLAVGIAMLGALLSVASAPARAAETVTPMRYSFEDDALFARPAGVTIQAGDLEVAPEVPAGKGLRGKAKGGPNNVAAGRFDKVIGSRMTVIWTETAVSGGDSHGFTLRHTEAYSGYLFLVNGVTLYEPNTVGIYKVRNGTVRKLHSVPLTWAPKRSFLAEADGTKLTLAYSDTAAVTPTNPAWRSVIEVHDYDDYIQAGGLQYTSGWNGSDATRTTIDEMTAYVVGAAGVVDLVTPSSQQVVQRSTVTPTSDIEVSGGYAGSPTAIEGRIDNGPWQTVDAAPTAGRFSGKISGATTGKRKIEVRFKDQPAITDVADPVGVGDVFVVAGQSNAVGHGWANQTYTTPSGLMATMFGNDYRWKPLADPLDSPVGQLDEVSADGDAGGSVWPLVASKLMADRNVPVAFIPSARNGTWIGQWQRNNEDPFGNHTLYGSMARRARGAGKVRAVLFWQGESDAFNGSSKAQYRQLLDKFAADVRSDLGVPTVVAQIGEGDMPAERLDPVRLAQRESWDAGTTVAGPSLYDIHPDDDGVHFRTDPELRIAAHRWWLAIRAGIYSEGDGRGPRLSAASLSADRRSVTVVLTDVSGFAGGTQGFSVAVGGTKVTIASVTTPAPGTYVVNLAQPAAPATVTVSLGKGHDGADKQVPTDGNGLPAEVFVDALAA